MWMKEMRDHPSGNNKERKRGGMCERARVFACMQVRLFACGYVLKKKENPWKTVILCEVRVCICACVCVCPLQRGVVERKPFSSCVSVFSDRSERRSVLLWMGEQGVCLSVSVGVVTLRSDLCVKEREGEEMMGCWSCRRWWTDAVDGLMDGWEPTTDLSSRVRVCWLGTGGEEIHRGLPRLAFLLLHCLL